MMLTNPYKRIVSFFFPYGGFRAVSRKHSNIIAQWKQFVMDT